MACRASATRARARTSGREGRGRREVDEAGRCGSLRAGAGISSIVETLQRERDRERTLRVLVPPRPVGLPPLAPVARERPRHGTDDPSAARAAHAVLDPAEARDDGRAPHGRRRKRAKGGGTERRRLDSEREEPAREAEGRISTALAGRREEWRARTGHRSTGREARRRARGSRPPGRRATTRSPRSP